jgi:hypothetical protein
MQVALASVLVSSLGALSCLHSGNGASAGLAGEPSTPVDDSAPLGSLNWGNNPATGKPWTVAELRDIAATDMSSSLGRALRRILAKSQETLDEPLSPVPQIQIEGTLFNDPQHVASEAAIAPLNDLVCWSLCARIATDPLASECAKKTTDALVQWLEVNQPTGNPINDSPQVATLLALDLALPNFTPTQRAQATAWARLFLVRGEAFFAALSADDGRAKNNFRSWSLALRALAAKLSANDDEISRTSELLGSHLAVNLAADGASIDFTVRDALYYHIYDLLPLVDIGLFAPEVMTDDVRGRIDQALQFMKPYFTGEKIHIEFVHTQVPFDITRRDAGDPEFQNVAWVPSKARLLFRLARGVFPDIQSWTGNVVDEDYHPIDKAVAALHGG